MTSIKYLPVGCILLLILLSRCANPVTPEGGPKDIVPPKVVECNPSAMTLNFSNKEIRITFNEYLQLKDPNNQINISPPTLPHTDIRLRGKSILIKLNDTLRSNTTYSINFGDAIADLTENNILHDFTYTFSTGTYIDSLSLSGKIINAFDHVTQKDVFAMLYINENDTLPLDSLPLHVKPYYMAKTKEDGRFHFRNLRNVTFLLTGLKDMNADYIFDLPNEKVAFCDSIAKGIYTPFIPVDTLKKDTLISRDTLVPADTTKKSLPGYTLHLFEESDSVQRVVKADLVNEGQVGIFFRFPVSFPEFNPLNISPIKDWMQLEFNPTMDSAYIWLPSVTIDSLILQIRDKGKTIDTARIDLNKKRLRKKGNKEAAVLPKLFLSNNVSDGRLNLFKNNPVITFNYPVVRCNLSRILLIEGKDTINPKCAFSDTVKRKLQVNHKWKEGQKYQLIIPDSVFYSMNGRSNDTLILSFKTYSIQDFGSIQVGININSPSGNYIIQLLNEKEVVQEQRILSGSGKVKFEYLFPAKYKVKAIFDRNRNGHWDTGKYSLKLQPEKVQYFPQVIEVRANWDIDETWEL